MNAVNKLYKNITLFKNNDNNTVVTVLTAYMLNLCEYRLQCL